jgi:putative intracellular protease/amidase
MKVSFILGSDADEIDFFNVNSLLDKCKEYIAIEIDYFGADKFARTKSGFIIPTIKIDEANVLYDAIIISGSKNYDKLVKTSMVKDFLIKNIEHGCHVYSICSGTKLLGELKLIDGFNVSVHQQKEPEYSSYKVQLYRGIFRDRWLTTIASDDTYSYLKSIECFYQILNDYFPKLYETIVKRVEVKSKVLEEAKKEIIKV